MRLGAPTSFWRRINAPVLVLNGGLDSQVPAAAHVPAIMSALQHPLSTSIVFPKKNHMFQNATTGSVGEYDEIEELISSDVLYAMSEWLEENVYLTPGLD
jgi:dienelactone hydrolase